MKTLRDYQLECKTKTQQILGIEPSAIIVMATGLGKTVVLSRIASEWDHGNVLVMAHRIELVDQLAESIANELGYWPMIEQGDRGCDPELLHQGGLIVVGSIQSMISQRRLRKFKDNPFGLIIIDECHRATSPSYANLVDHYAKLLPSVRVLGVTATPNRTDKTALGLVFKEVAFNMGIIPGIDEGWLVDIHQKFAVLGEVDFSKLRTKKNEFGEVDFRQEDLEKYMTEEKVMHEMSHPILDLSSDGKQAMIFTSSVAHAHLWAMVLNRYREGCAVAIDGTTDKDQRKQAVGRFKNRELQFLLNFGVFTEGFDAPNTSIVVMGRPTKSVLTYTQMLGRGTRPLPGIVDGIPTADGRKDAIAASSKPHVTVLDFVGNSKHKIVNATDVLGGNFDVDIKEVAAGRLKKNQGNVREAIQKARAAMILLAEMKKRKEFVFEGVDYSLQDVDTFSSNGAANHVPKTRGGASDTQVAMLVKLGVPYETAILYSNKQAWAVINSQKKKRCTDGQAKVLKRFGYNPDQFNTKAASDKISEISANGWRRPD